MSLNNFYFLEKKIGCSNLLQLSVTWRSEFECTNFTVVHIFFHLCFYLKFSRRKSKVIVLRNEVRSLFSVFTANEKTKFALLLVFFYFRMPLFFGFTITFSILDYNSYPKNYQLQMANILIYKYWQSLFDE